MKKKIFLAAGAFVAVCCGSALFLHLKQEAKPLSALAVANIEALADNENGYGWFWEKEWTTCEIKKQIIITKGCAQFSVGAILPYNAEIVAAISSCSATYTVVGGGAGRKSYCNDGWSSCSSDDCR